MEIVKNYREYTIFLKFRALTHCDNSVMKFYFRIMKEEKLRLQYKG